MKKDAPTNEPVLSGFVVYGLERLRDGYEEWAKCFAKKETALSYINDIVGRGIGNYEFRLFELGSEVPLEAADIEVPQPAKVTKQFKAGPAPPSRFVKGA